ncbi:hypothetical protein D8Y31_07065 [Escherichia coli]|nr:hypothetical protein D8Y31_07065 [Escherichia coli]
MTDFGGKTSIFSHPVYLFLRKFSLQDSRGGSNARSSRVISIPLHFRFRLRDRCWSLIYRNMKFFIAIYVHISFLPVVGISRLYRILVVGE